MKLYHKIYQVPWEDIPTDASGGDFGDYDERTSICYSPIAQASTQSFGSSGGQRY